MSAVLERTAPAAPALRRDRARWAAGLLALTAFGWSLAGAGVLGGDVVNAAGLGQLGRFAAGALSPATEPAFLRVLLDSALITVAYAAVGAALALLLGAVGAVAVARTTRGRRRAGRLTARAALALPRGLHEAVWGLLLLNVLGLDPWVGVLAIALPYGAVSATVFADLVDEVPRAGYEALLAAGAGRGAAALYGLLPEAAGGLLSYAFYRLECAVRSAVVLGLIGAGGLGYQLSLSFTSLRWEQVWSAVYALAALCLVTDLAGRAVRRRLAGPRHPGGRRDPLLTGAVMGALALTAWSWWFLAVSPAALVSGRAGAQLAALAGSAWPPATEPALLRRIAVLALETVQMSVLAIGLAALGAFAVASVAARPAGPASMPRRAAGVVLRLLLLLLRSVPPPVWALVLLFVLLPGVLPGALALALYEFGVLGRLVAGAAEEADPRPAAALTALGARPAAGRLYGLLPQLAGPGLALASYRWEVAVRETVVIGLLGSGGLGLLLSGQVAAFHWAGITTTLGALIVLTLAVDLVSERARRTLR